jgi:hypothetical protein
MYNLLRSTEGADAMGPLSLVCHASAIAVTVVAVIGEWPVGVPDIDAVPQYFGHPDPGDGTRRNPGSKPGPGSSAAATSKISAIAAMACLIVP